MLVVACEEREEEVLVDEIEGGGRRNTDKSHVIVDQE